MERERRSIPRRRLRNAVVVAMLITAGQVFFSAMAAYAFARLRWRHRDKVFAFFLMGLMVPTIFTLLPNFVLIKSLGLVDTVLGIALPSMLMTPFAVFVTVLVADETALFAVVVTVLTTC